MNQDSPPSLHPRTPAALQAWLASSKQEPPLEPALPIIDAHHHLWDDARGRYLVDEITADIAGGHNVVATVFIEARSMYRANGPAPLRPVGETEFVRGVAAMSASGSYGPARVCAGIVGYADLALGAAVEPALAAHVEAAGGRFRGIRYPLARDASDFMRPLLRQKLPHIMRDPAFRAGIATLAAFGLSFEAWLFHTQHFELVDLARACPTVPIILNHVGGPLGIGPYAGRRQEVFDLWRASLQELARCPNVVVKLGGLGMLFPGFDFHEQERPPASQDLALAWRPYIETCITAFGVDRCLFESNFPVDKQSCDYSVLWNAFKRITANCSTDEKAALYHDTAARVYRLESSAEDEHRGARLP